MRLGHSCAEGILDHLAIVVKPVVFLAREALTLLSNPALVGRGQRVVIGVPQLERHLHG